MSSFRELSPIEWFVQDQLILESWFKRRCALRDDQWDRIEPLLPGKTGDRGRTARANRFFVDAVLCRYGAGQKNALHRAFQGGDEH